MLFTSMYLHVIYTIEMAQSEFDEPEEEDNVH